MSVRTKFVLPKGTLTPNTSNQSRQMIRAQQIKQNKYSLVRSQIIELRGPPGPPGLDGRDGIDGRDGRRLNNINMYGGVYTTIPIEIGSTNTLLKTISFVPVTQTATYLITVNFTISYVSGTPITYLTLSRQAGLEATTDGINLSKPDSTLITDINTYEYYLVISNVSSSITLMDTPVENGPITYGLWGFTYGITNNIKANISIIQLTQ
jgi:hypothetical protein